MSDVNDDPTLLVFYTTQTNQAATPTTTAATPPTSPGYKLAAAPFAVLLAEVILPLDCSLPVVVDVATMREPGTLVAETGAAAPEDSADDAVLVGAL